MKTDDGSGAKAALAWFFLSTIGRPPFPSIIFVFLCVLGRHSVQLAPPLLLHAFGHCLDNSIVLPLELPISQFFPTPPLRKPFIVDVIDRFPA